MVGVCQLIVFRHIQSHGALCAEIESVHVHPDQRGHGVGHILMEAAIERACQKEDFRPKTGPLCKHCHFQPFCPAFGGDPALAAPTLLIPPILRQGAA